MTAINKTEEEAVTPTREQLKKMDQAQKNVFNAKSRIGLKELEMMKKYVFNFPLSEQDFKVEPREGVFGNYGALILKFHDLGSENADLKELVVNGDDFIERFFTKFREGIQTLSIKKVEYKGQGNRKFDIEVERA